MTCDTRLQLALQNGMDVKTVSSMLGHYDAGFTLRTYTHATRQMQRSAADFCNKKASKTEVFDAFWSWWCDSNT